MDGLSAINELNALTAELADSIDELRRLGIEYASADRDYRIEKAKNIRRLRADGTPSTLTLDLATGDAAAWKFTADSAEVMWKAEQEHINSLKLRIKILENQIAREWGRP